MPLPLPVLTFADITGLYWTVSNPSCNVLDIMFAKVFYQIFESSISEDYILRHVFMDLLVLADDEGVIDKTPEAIARITNVPLKIVTHSIHKLSQPDPKSRTPDEDGRRLALIDQHRDWGWRIINYPKYRLIRDEEARRIANRSYKRIQRAKAKEQEPAKPPRAPRRKKAMTSEPATMGMWDGKP